MKGRRSKTKPRIWRVCGCRTVGAAGGGVGDELPHGALPLQRVGEVLLPAINHGTETSGNLLGMDESETVSRLVRTVSWGSRDAT